MKKKILPVIIAIVLIIIIIGVAFGKQIIEKYTYSKEVYDMTTYFENKSESDVAIILQDDFMSERAVYLDGTYYLDMETVLTYFNKRFYFDENEGLLIYTLPLDMFTARLDETTVSSLTGDEDLGYVPVRKDGEKVLIALDYVKRYTNLSYEAFTDPGRLQIYTEWNDRTVATVKKNTQVRHRGGIKSPILKEVKQGDRLTVLEQMEDWSKVKTDDAIIGFIENKRLTDIKPELPIPVTDHEDPVYTDLCRDHKINMGWHAIAGEAGNDTLDSVVARTKGLNVIAPTWWVLSDDEGGYRSIASASYVSKAHGMGLEVWAVLNNVDITGVNIEAVLSSTTNRRRLIDAVTGEAVSLGVDGINLDFEQIPVSAGDDFSEFVREMSISCRANGLVFSIDNYVPIGGTGYYDRTTQGEVADYVIIMGYDEHYAGGNEAGSVASIGFVETGIEMTLEEVPARKVINGIPFYTRIWSTMGTDVSCQTVEMTKISDWLSAHSLSPEWDDATCQNYAEYNENQALIQCWIEDADSIRAKLSVMNAHELAGVAEWRLGFETPDIWDVIAEYMSY
ncbi:MAG: chitinase [Lachnospiraceae bacterium]|nr:chitinase [Lachnospiraceae bacterium]